MNRLFILTVTAMLILTACAPIEFVQLFNIKPIAPVTNRNDTYVFENDTLRITYEFWEEHGVLAFDVYNKLNVPIYLDWRKSIFLQNGQKIDYWQDVETVSAKTVTKNAGVSQKVFQPVISVPENGKVVTYGTTTTVGYGNGVAYSNAVKTKPERITFIAPYTSIQRAQFVLFDIDGVRMSKGDIEFNYVNRTYSNDSSKKTPFAYRNYNTDDSPLNFRNFLTFSTNENFTSEFYADNGFYVNRITVMTKKQFDCKDDYSYKDARSFYIHLNEVDIHNYYFGIFAGKKGTLIHNVWTGEWLQK